VTVRKDAPLKKVDTMLKATQRARDEVEISYICRTKVAINKGWEIKPTAKSETARLVSNIFAGECNEDVFQIAIIIVEFPNSAVRQRKTLTTQIAIVWFISSSEYPLDWQQSSFSPLLSCEVEFEA